MRPPAIRMSPDQLAQERRRGRFAAAATLVSAIAFAAGSLWYQSATADQPDENKADILRYFDAHSDELLASSLLQGFGMLLIAAAAVHLYLATKARNPDQSAVVLVVGLYGPIAFAATLFVRSIALSVLASDFAGREFQTLAAAEDAFDSPALVVSDVLGVSGVLGLGFWLVKGSLDAMRVGLLTRFMGVLGIALGPALILRFGLLVLPLWLIALAVLFAGLWPRGMPPAWVTGEAQPWQSPQDARAEAGPEVVGGERNGDVEAVGPGVRKPGQESGGRGPERGRG
jgi:hypothetical protein